MQGANSGMPGDQAKSLFDQGLSQMAYNVLINKLPNISPDVVTFKVLDSDPEAGSGVGAFVVQRQGQLIYVPVVMADNQIKPLDILYFKDLNIFLPLSKEWLEEIGKMSLGELGQGTQPPKTLNSDVDIRNMVVPPTTGRYSYAAEDGAGRVFDEARVQIDPTPAFLNFLDGAPNRVKRAAARLLETRPKLLKMAVHHYGATKLLSALQVTEEKVAEEGELSRAGGLFIANKKTKPPKFKDIWGDQAGVAFQGVAVKGYYAKDDRKGLKHAVKEQNELKLTEPKEAGAYRLWSKDGKEVLAFVVNGARDFFASADGHTSSASSFGRNRPRNRPHTTKRYVGVTSTGKLIDAMNLLGEQIPMGELSGKIFKSLEGEGDAAPKIGQCGIFVKREGAGGYVATEPVIIKTITTVEKVKRIEVARDDYEHASTKTLVFDGSGRTMHAKGTHVHHMSTDYRWVPVEGKGYDQRLCERDFLTDPRDVLNLTVTSLTKEGAERVIVKKGSHGFVFGNGAKIAYDFDTALEKLARDSHIAVDDAAAALEKAAATGRFEFYVIGSAGLAKMAAEGGSSKKQPDQADPAQQAMDQVMAAQMAQPQGPSPVEMAVAEQMQNLQGQMLAIQQQQQMLANLQNRAQMIAGGGGAAAAPGAAAAAMAGPMDPSMMGAGAPVDPSGQMGAGAPQPGMAPAGPPPGMPGMQPQMPPGPTGTGMQMPPQQGQPQPGQAPMAGAQGAQPGQPMQPGMQPGMDPNQPPPQATMTSEDGSIDSILSQVNPQFIEQAGQLNDAGAFDAAALGSMAQTPQLKDLVSAYIPNLEKSLDNIGRVLLTLWMDESKLKEDIGDETFVALEDNLRTTFKGLGQLILRINQNTAVLRTDGAVGGN
jgi:hypothetical protein